MICRLQVIRISSEQLLKDYPHQRQAISWNLTDSKAKKNFCNAKMLPLLLFKNFNVLSSEVVSATETSWWSWLGNFFLQGWSYHRRKSSFSCQRNLLEVEAAAVDFCFCCGGTDSNPGLALTTSDDSLLIYFLMIIQNWVTSSGVNRFFRKISESQNFVFRSAWAESISLLCATSSRH